MSKPASEMSREELRGHAFWLLHLLADGSDSPTVRKQAADAYEAEMARINRAAGLDR